MVRSELTADDSLAAMRARSRFGMAIAAIIRIIATTISNSISEKPFCFRISFSPLLPLAGVVSIDPIREYLRNLRTKEEGYQRRSPARLEGFVFNMSAVFGVLVLGLCGSKSVRFCLRPDKLCHFGNRSP